MPRLITFGGLSLVADDGSTPIRLRPQRLALLAVLAAATPRGVTRERLLGLFWPDSDEEAARHSLRQALYSLRHELGRDPVRGTGADLRLDLAVLGADVSELHAALGAGDRGRAADLVTGPFLDGFYLSNAPEFERWVEEERGRLAALAMTLLEGLARDTEAAGDADSALARRRQLTLLDPVSGRHALAYLKALSARGERAEALAFARTHEANVRRVLEADPDPQVQQMVRELRAMAPPAPEPRAAPTLAPGPRPAYLPAVGPRAKASPRRRLVLAGVVTAALGLAALALWRARGEAEAPSRVLAVGFVGEAGLPDSLRIGGVLIDMLATNLGRIEGLSVLANSRVLEMMPDAGVSRAGGYGEAARRAGATEILEGHLRAGPGLLALELSRVDLRRGLVLNAYRVTAPDRYALVDSATAAIAADLRVAIPAGSVSEATTRSPIAYRLYEEALRAHFQADHAAAYRLLRAAMDEDPDFVMATYYAALSSLDLYPDSVPVFLRRARDRASRSPARVRHLIAARYAWVTQEIRAVAVADTLAVLLPDDPEAQRLIGTIRATAGDFGPAVAAYNRAIALDSAALASPRKPCRLCNALAELTGVYQWWDSTGAAERTLRRWVRLRPDDPNGWADLAPFLERLGRWEEAGQVWPRAVALGRPPDREGSMLSLAMQGHYAEAEQALRAMLGSPRPETRGSARWYLLIVLRNRGRLREAAEVLGRGGSGQMLVQASDTLPSDPINQAILAFDAGRFRDAARQFHAISAGFRADSFPGRRARTVSWWLTLSATASAAAGDTARVRALADSVGAISAGSLYGRDPGLPYFLRGLLAAREGRHGEAVQLFRQAHYSPTYGFTRINYELGRSLLALGRAEEAVAAVQPALRGGIDGSNLYITRTELHELLAQAFDRAGRPDSAAAHYRAVADAWERADPPFAPRLRAARTWLARHRSAG
ncbi:MAG: BTAD domain-containing putative transcriptional regulator [Gemmatimonadales bacterium]